MGDARDRQGMEPGVCGDEVVRSGGGGEAEVQGIGGLHACGGTEVGKAFGDVGAEGKNRDSGRGEKAPIFGGCEQIRVALGQNEDFSQNQVAGQKLVMGGAHTGEEFSSRCAEDGIAFQDVHPNHGVEIKLHSPQASRSRRRTSDGPPSSGNQPFMLPSRLQSRAHHSSRVRGFSSRSLDGGVGLEAMTRSWAVLRILYAGGWVLRRFQGSGELRQ